MENGKTWAAKMSRVSNWALAGQQKTTAKARKTQ
jgi:hypothetical protein